MGCLLILLTGAAPRLAAVLYWIWRPGLWDRAFSGSWIWPVLGILFLPVTTIVWVLVATNGVTGFDFLWLGLADRRRRRRERPERGQARLLTAARRWPGDRS